MPWNGEEFVQSYSPHATDVVGFAWNTEAWCPRCLLQALGMVATGPVVGGSFQITSAITLYGFEQAGLLMDDPRWQDSAVIPQPIFGSENGVHDRCCRCHEHLIESDETDES